MAETRLRASKQLFFDADIDHNGKKITNLGTPTNTTDAATKQYVDNAVTGLLDDRGNFDASTSAFPTSATGLGGSGTAGAILKGDTWFVSVGGTVSSIALQAGDSVRAMQDSPTAAWGSTGWDKLATGGSLGYTAENISNKVTAFSTPTDTQYPSAKLVSDQLALKLAKNGAISAGTGTKVTYDANGLVTSSTNATTTDISEGTNQYFTNARALSAAPAETSATISTILTAATSKTTPVDADVLSGYDSAGSVLAKFTWANIKATLKTYFDTLYTTKTVIMASRVCREIPTGTMNGSNVAFTLANTPISGSEMVFVDGILQNAGAGYSYTISGATITFNTAPISTDTILVTYWK